MLLIDLGKLQHYQMDNHKMMNNGHSRRIGGIGKWFHHHKDSSHSGSVRRKDRIRAENAHMHAALSIAGLATALAAIAAADSSSSGSKMSRAVASATELLASHCIEITEQAGAEHDRVASAVRSAVDVRSPGDLMTMTAAAATGIFASVLCDLQMVHGIFWVRSSFVSGHFILQSDLNYGQFVQ